MTTVTSDLGLDVPGAFPSRRARKKERTRRQIYAAATALFAERGFDRVTVGEICAHADVAKATFFLHFPTKSALLFEYGRVVAAELAEDLAGSEESAASQFRRVARVLAERWLEQEQVMRTMLHALLADPAALHHASSKGSDLEQLLTAIVKRGQSQGEFRSQIAPRLAASVFLSGCLSVLAAPPRRHQPAHTVRDQLLELVLNGLVDPRAREGNGENP